MAEVGIFVGTMYGNSLLVAEEAEAILASQGHKATVYEDPELADWEKYKDKYILVVTSTTGQGDLPDSIVPLFQGIKDQLGYQPDVRYGIIALGDSAYANFCGGGKQFDALLQEQSAQRVGEMLLIDAGVEVNSLYTADITRTFPTNGKFTDFQKKLYQAVLDSQQAGFEAAKPGATYSDIHHACMRVIAERLHDWGILPVDVEESLSPEGQQHRRWLACGVAHHLGLDVHDCAQARYESYQGAAIRPGMIFTIEPGLYFREDDLLIPPEYRGIGIRVEDDVLMTEDGPEWISAGIPKQIDEVEEWMANMAAEGAKA